MSHRYYAFGQIIDSDVRLDELSTVPVPSAAQPIRIQHADVGVELLPFGAAPAIMDYDHPDGVLMAWHGVCAVLVKDSRTVLVQPHPDVAEHYLAFPLLGPVMGWVLDQCGYLVLHASAVDFGGRTFAFLGDKGAGKSTTAAACLNAGAKLVTDDLLVIDCGHADGSEVGAGAPRVHTAFAQVKLNEVSSDASTIHGAVSRPLVFKGFPKRQFQLEETADPVVSCDVVCVLRRTDGPFSVDWMSATQSLGRLFRYAYNIRFDGVPDRYRDASRHFRNCARLADTARIGVVHMPHDMERLPESIAALRALAGEPPS